MFTSSHRSRRSLNSSSSPLQASVSPHAHDHLAPLAIGGGDAIASFPSQVGLEIKSWLGSASSPGLGLGRQGWESRLGSGKGSGRPRTVVWSRRGCGLAGAPAAWPVPADTKSQNHPALHTGHEEIKRLLKCHLLNRRFQLINPSDLEVPGGQTFAKWPLEQPCSLEGEPAL